MSAARTMEALDLVARERTRQDILKREGRFAYTLADPEMTLSQKLVALTEEVGEAAKEVLALEGIAPLHDRPPAEEWLRGELIQVAALAVAWVEALL